LQSSQHQLDLVQVSLKASVGAHYLLQDISFRAAQGDRIAIVGPSGAGKTSLLRVLNRLSEASQGSIYFEQQDIRQIPVVQLRQQITLVPQESKLLGMTVKQALVYPLVLRGVERALIEQRLRMWMEQLHIPSEWLDRTEVQLSVGQRQLVAIGRALMIQPKVLLLDEPTSALDAGRSEHLVHVLQDVAKTISTTILMVNHQLEIAEQFCNRLLYLQQGRLSQDLATAQVKWTELKQTLIDQEATAAEEWA
jgi:D-methionine transport system ATP-binding protein